MLCTLQLQPHLLIMESKPSTSTTISTTTKQDPMPSQQSTAPGKKESNADTTSSTPNPVPTSVVQKYVTDAAAIISSSQATRRMFMMEDFRTCNEIARWEEKTGKTSPENPKPTPSVGGQSTNKLPQYVSCPNYSDGRFIPSGTNKVLDRLIDNCSMPNTSTAPSSSTSTVTSSATTGGSTSKKMIWIRICVKGKNRRRTSKPSLHFVFSNWYG